MPTGLRSAHGIWLLRRAAVLEGMTAYTAEPPDLARAAVFHRVAAKVWRAVEESRELTLTPEECFTLGTEAEELTDRATREIHADKRDLQRAEEWLRTARALREIVESGGAAEPTTPFLAIRA